MPIVGPEAPPNGLRAIESALAHLRPRANLKLSPNSAALAFGGASPPSKPVPLYSVGLDDIRDPGFLTNATPAGWRYLLLDGGPIAAADVDSEKNTEVSFSRLTQGAQVESLLRATQAADAKYGGDTGNYEPRVLEIPSLYVSAFWLHGSEDHFFPYAGVESENAKLPAEDRNFLSNVFKRAEDKRRLLSKSPDQTNRDRPSFK